MEIQFDHVGLAVADIEGAAEFYANALGFEREFAFELAPHPIRGLMLRHPCGFRLELFQHQESEPGVQGATPIEALGTLGYGHFALSAPAIDELFACAIEAGAAPVVDPGQSPEPGVRFAFLFDPEGNLIELVQRG